MSGHVPQPGEWWVWADESDCTYGCEVLIVNPPADGWVKVRPTHVGHVRVSDLVRKVS